ncbi:hypothetical protein L6164_028771 [Bauhinia variegata]|uniref:Uncharacterized protein n=1 Tax=Bauhinia variegata TaxID=167791 RepID=A0ACB9L771_BAUVA|nr:hypothetical protein L6164_028771 [Bauhinia variegata]
MPENVEFRTIPNVLPSELVRGSDFPGFYEAVMTKMEAPFETLLDRIESPVTSIIVDTELLWVVCLANRRNIPVALLWASSASVFSMLLHHDLINQKGHLGVDLPEHGEERIDFIPGVSSTRIADMPTVFHGNDERVLKLVLQCISMIKQAQHLLINISMSLNPKPLTF